MHCGNGLVDRDILLSTLDGFEEIELDGVFEIGTPCGLGSSGPGTLPPCVGPGTTLPPKELFEEAAYIKIDATNPSIKTRPTPMEVVGLVWIETFSQTRDTKLVVSLSLFQITSFAPF